MSVSAAYAAANRALASVLDRLRTPLLLACRLYVSWQFLKSGWLKLGDWDTTLWLFREEYHVPLLPPEWAAVAGTVGETLFALSLIAGFASRPAALGLFAVNVLAVISYRHVLLAPGYEAALAQHVLWGFMLLVLIAFGPGRVSVDQAAIGNGVGRAIA
ncbi:MAG TPA: DoxX family protein [Steroidobacteraceae bacterium]|nr:DoxX family protein [Steroidobacteraceae bacterium]HNS27584.1 DoxX family protein [Steroidobacteraceae bacterium]